ncbi:MAG TPA: dTDP-4-dehydrorhamnose reductase [Desulfobacteraceae bacterium]|nr:dTDP-4-dehydrorhamnose reductase [Desulfobacteraceae bacterium]
MSNRRNFEMKILILGGSGMLGSECKEVLGRRHEIITPDRESLNIVSWDQVIDRLQQISPEIVLNCAGFTDVDACEEEDFAVRKINVEGPRNLAQGAARFGSKLIHISSDYVFDGQKTLPQPYFEDDLVRPLSAYAKSKAESETAVRENSPDYIILRTGWLYSRGGSNFIKAILSAALKLRNSALKVVDDQFGSPTWTYRVAHQIEALLNRGGRGTYHATSEGFCSKFEWAAFVVEKLGLKVPVEPCKTEDFPTPARRPVNSILENRLLKKQGINVMRDWKEDLNEFLDLYGEDLIKEASRD